MPLAIVNRILSAFVRSTAKRATWQTNRSACTAKMLLMKERGREGGGEREGRKRHRQRQQQWQQRPRTKKQPTHIAFTLCGSNK